MDAAIIAAIIDRAEILAVERNGLLMRLPRQTRRRYLAQSVLKVLRGPPPQQVGRPQPVSSPHR